MLCFSLNSVSSSRRRWFLRRHPHKRTHRARCPVQQATTSTVTTPTLSPPLESSRTNSSSKTSKFSQLFAILATMALLSPGLRQHIVITTFFTAILVAGSLENFKKLLQRLWVTVIKSKIVVALYENFRVAVLVAWLFALADARPLSGFIYGVFGYSCWRTVKPVPVAECAVCLEMVCSRQACTLPCKHTFHYQCLHEWGQYSASCPLCRKEL